MIKNDIKIKESRILNLGITFKENCPDIRNSKAIDVITNLEDYGAKVTVYDPWANSEEVRKEYSLDCIAKLSEESEKYDVIILTVSHEEFLTIDLNKYLKEGGVIYDVKGVLLKENIDRRL